MKALAGCEQPVGSLVPCIYMFMRSHEQGKKENMCICVNYMMMLCYFCIDYMMFLNKIKKKTKKTFDACYIIVCFTDYGYGFLHKRAHRLGWLSRPQRL